MVVKVVTDVENRCAAFEFASSFSRVCISSLERHGDGNLRAFRTGDRMIECNVRDAFAPTVFVEVANMILFVSADPISLCGDLRRIVLKDKPVPP